MSQRMGPQLPTGTLPSMALIICARVGFANVSHFNRTFRKIVGISPTTYKKMYPLDLNGSLGNHENITSVLGSQITTIAEVFGIFQTSNTSVENES